MLLKVNPTTGNLDLVQNPANLGTLVNIGTDDTDPGVLNIYGDKTGNDLGGSLRVFNSADFDTTIEHYQISVDKDNLIIGPDIDPDLITIDAAKEVYITDGDFYIRNPTTGHSTCHIGQEGSHRGEMSIYGNGPGSLAGGSFYLYNSDDNDTNNNLFQFQAYNTELIFGPQADPFAFTMTEAKDIKITDGDLFITNPTDGVTKVSIGVNDSVYGQIYLYGHAASAVNGGEINLYCAADHDTSIDNFSIKVYEDDLRIGTDGVAEIITLSSESAVVINEGSNDIDFRVESNGNANMLFVDAGNDKVGIGTGTPNSLVEIATPTEAFEIIDAGSAGATEQDWIQVEIGGNTGYIRVFATV